VVPPFNRAELGCILSLLGCGPSGPGFSVRRPESVSTHIFWIRGRWNVGQRPFFLCIAVWDGDDAWRPGPAYPRPENRQMKSPRRYRGPWFTKSNGDPSRANTKDTRSQPLVVIRVGAG